MSKNAKRRLKEIQAKQARADGDRFESLVQWAEDCASETGSEGLDGLVHDLKSSEASGINNGGVRGQVEYIIEKLGDGGYKRIEGILNTARKVS